ncbi:MAG: M56 family metallopeptidase, partial [Rhodanobacteraceae bacterium]|nr:M56 family metallopeptidase [Rhodanobacteraceae bacterium]
MDALQLVVNAIGWTLIHSIWLGALAAAAYAVPAARLRNHAPQSAYAWGLACLLGLVLMLGVVFVHEFDRVRENADVRAIAAAYAALPVATSGLAEGAPAPAPTSSLASLIEPMLPLLVLLWALAVMAIGAGLVRSQLALRRLVTAGVALPQMAAPVVELARWFGVSRPIAVVSSAVARAPFVIGHFSPVIVLPLEVATGMPWAQLKLILAHEIAHLRRADYLVNWLQIALEVLLFFHPAVRWLSEEMRRLREACCDDMVVDYAGGRADYTRALLSLEEFRHDAPMLAPSAVAGGLLWRVQRIAGRAPNERAGLQKIVLPAVLLGFAATLIGGGVQVRPGSGPRDLALPQAELIGTSVIALDTRIEADWQARLPPLADARSTPPPAPVAPVVRIPFNSADAPADRAGAPPVTGIDEPQLTPAPVLVEPAAIDLRPIRSVAPDFPARERIDGILAVELGYALDANGLVVGIETVSAPEDAAPFIESARAALAQWQYSAEAAAELGKQRLRHRFVFRDQPSADPGAGQCSMVTGTRICVVDVRPERREVSPLNGRRCSVT